MRIEDEFAQLAAQQEKERRKSERESEIRQQQAEREEQILAEKRRKILSRTIEPILISVNNGYLKGRGQIEYANDNSSVSLVWDKWRQSPDVYGESSIRADLISLPTNEIYIHCGREIGADTINANDLFFRRKAIDKIKDILADPSRCKRSEYPDYR